MEETFDRIKVREVAFQATDKAARVLRQRFGQPHTVRKKRAIDLVTEADEQSEHIIVDTIHHAFPTHDMVAEEGSLIDTGSPYQWIIDPLDGTTNFAHHIPHFCISIALAVRGRLVFGLVENPMWPERFWAASGEGAFMNNKSIRVSSTVSIPESLLVTGFPYELHPAMDLLIRRFQRCMAAAQGIRRFGSAALDLCYVACGRFEGFWEQHLKPWDTAAGVLILREAGGMATDFSGSPHEPASPELLATNGSIHQEMLHLLHPGNV
ncbi:MAG: inositol monophosphatase family protein [bacterium]